MITLFPSQRTAADEIRRLASRFLADGQAGTIILRAPTGAGKTVIAGVSLQELMSDAQLGDLCTVWIAPFRLHGQGKARIEVVNDGSLTPLEREELHSPRLEQSSILFINWSAINKKEKNNFRRGGEQRLTLAGVCDGARAEGRRILLVIDESHLSKDTDISREVISEIGPAVVLEMSATPTSPSLEDAPFGLVEVERDVAAGEGIIRAHIEINNGLADVEPSTIAINELIDLALKKRDELARDYTANGIPVNPLLLVQLPDADAGEMTVEDMKARLAMSGITEGNGRLAVWLSDEHTVKFNDPELIGNTGQIEVLLFKQAIATGWDCPRAQVLLKLRSAGGGGKFAVQTVGRIMRTPERRHYAKKKPELEYLDWGYVYHGQNDYDARGEFLPIFNKTAHLREDITPLKLPTTIWDEEKSEITLEEVDEVLSLVEDHFGLSSQAAQKANLASLAKAGIDLAASPEDALSAGWIDFDDGQLVQITASFSVATLPSLINAQFHAKLQSWLSPYKDPGHEFVTGLYAALAQRLGFTKPSEVQRIVLAQQNQKSFEVAIRDAAAQVSSAHNRTRQSRRDVIWEIPEVRRYLVPEKPSPEAFRESPRINHYAYEKCFLKQGSQPERAFQQRFEGALSSRIKWWFKAGEEAIDFSLPYWDGRAWHKFFPDFFVGFESGVIGLYETKDAGAFDSPTNVQKLDALRCYAIEQQKQGGPALHVGFVLREEKGLFFYEEPATSTPLDKVLLAV